MLAQPFIENSIEHGILPKETKGHIDVKLYLEKNVIHIDVKDNGIGFKASSEMKKDKKHESLALKITRERILMICKKYKQKARFSISDILDDNEIITGTKVSFDVPYSMI
jgi:sensor histidine kinase YesM